MGAVRAKGLCAAERPERMLQNWRENSESRHPGSKPRDVASNLGVKSRSCNKTLVPGPGAGYRPSGRTQIWAGLRTPRGPLI